MRVLLDEQIDTALRRHFADDFEVETVEYRGWKSLENGALLSRAARSFDAFITSDQGIEHQQPVQDAAMRFIVFEAPTNQIEHHRPLVAPAQKALREMASGEIRRVKAPS